MLEAPTITNRLLAGLPAASLERVSPCLMPVAFARDQVLHSADQPLARLFFVESGLVSLMSAAGRRGVETCLVGSDGLVGALAILGARNAASTAVARLDGSALAIERADFERCVREDPEMRRCVERYLQQHMAAATHSVVAATLCTIEQRLAGWLLLAQDRIGESEIDLTHECLAGTLGVRRPGVTVALHLLEGKQAIRSLRRRIVIRSRERLLAIAGSAYSLQTAGREHDLAVAAG